VAPGSQTYTATLLSVTEPTFLIVMESLQAALLLQVTPGPELVVAGVPPVTYRGDTSMTGCFVADAVDV